MLMPMASTGAGHEFVRGLGDHRVAERLEGSEQGCADSRVAEGFDAFQAVHAGDPLASEQQGSEDRDAQENGPCEREMALADGLPEQHAGGAHQLDEQKGEIRAGITLEP